MERILCLLVGYLCGSFLTAEVVTRRATGKSAREIGSGNPGMANVMSNVGKKEGVLVLVGDILKTALAMGLSWLLFGGAIGRMSLHWAGLGAVLGHNFPFWLKGKGGKGVTVSCVWLILGFGGWGILDCLAGALVVFLTGWLPLGAVVIGALAVPTGFLTGGLEAGLLACACCALMVSRHWHGLRRIARGEEKTKMKHFGLGKKKG